jgi:hypothetical protein
MVPNHNLETTMAKPYRNLKRKQNPEPKKPAASSLDPVPTSIEAPPASGCASEPGPEPDTQPVAPTETQSDPEVQVYEHEYGISPEEDQIFQLRVELDDAAKAVDRAEHLRAVAERRVIALEKLNANLQEALREKPKPKVVVSFAKGEQFLRIRSTRPHGFWRCKTFFGAKDEDFPRDKFTEEEIEVLKAEMYLSVREMVA